MKFRQVTRQVADTYTRDGLTVPITRTETHTEPKLPVDWQRVMLNTSVSIVMVLTIGAIAWSTYSIGALLGGGPVGYIAAGIFDLGWITAILLEFLARYDRRKRGFPKALSWVLLLVTMGAIFWHGMLLGHPEMAVVGAFVSAFAKLLWMGVMKHVNAELSSEDEQWVQHQISAAQAKAAVAQIRRQVSRVEQAAALELLAAERTLNGQSIAMDDVSRAQQTLTSDAARRASELVRPSYGVLPKADAIRLVKAQVPNADADEVQSLLEREGVSVDLAYVKKKLNEIAKEEESEAEIVEFPQQVDNR